MKRNAIIALSAACSILLGGTAYAEETTLAAGAGFRKPLAELSENFSKQTGHKILQVYGHIGQVIAQARESDEISLL